MASPIAAIYIFITDILHKTHGIETLLYSQMFYAIISIFIVIVHSLSIW